MSSEWTEKFNYNPKIFQEVPLLLMSRVVAGRFSPFRRAARCALERRGAIRLPPIATTVNQTAARQRPRQMTLRRRHSCQTEVTAGTQPARRRGNHYTDTAAGSPAVGCVSRTATPGLI